MQISGFEKAREDWNMLLVHSECVCVRGVVRMELVIGF